jgi:hypothetical protein
MTKKLWRIELHAGSKEKPCTSIDWCDAYTFLGALLGLAPVYRRLRTVTHRPLFAVYVTREG